MAELRRPHHCLAYQHNARPGCPATTSKHVVVACSCGERWSVDVADNISGTVRQHHPEAVWGRHAD